MLFAFDTETGVVGTVLRTLDGSFEPSRETSGCGILHRSPDGTLRRTFFEVKSPDLDPLMTTASTSSMSTSCAFLLLLSGGRYLISTVFFISLEVRDSGRGEEEGDGRGEANGDSDGKSKGFVG